MEATFRPIGEWPRSEETDPRRPSPYEIGWKQTLEDLKRELAHLGAEHVVVRLDLAENRIRRDGWPRQDARPQSPRVIVEFQRPDGRWLRYPCDTFDDWQGNMRAIALTLQDLRRAGNRGALAAGEQYEGSALELEAPGSAENEARALLDSYGGLRAALRATHPDRGGNEEDFRRVQEAREVLGL